MSGKGFLKLSSIFLVIWGIANIIIGVLLVTGFGIATDIVPDVQEKLMAASIVMFIVLGILELIGAKLGFATAKNAHKANKCLVIGFIIIAFQIGSVFMGDISSVDIVSLITSLAIPVLYVIGGFLRKANPQD